MTVRVATDDDWPAIREVHRRAFGDEGGEIVRLVDALRADPALYVPALSFVSTENDVVVGHVMNTWNLVGETRGLELAPLRVLAERHGRGSRTANVSGPRNWQRTSAISRSRWIPGWLRAESRTRWTRPAGFGITGFCSTSGPPARRR